MCNGDMRDGGRVEKGSEGGRGMEGSPGERLIGDGEL